MQRTPPCNNHLDTLVPRMQLQYSIAVYGNQKADLLPEQSVDRLLFEVSAKRPIDSGEW
jgi:hypothetical protein